MKNFLSMEIEELETIKFGSFSPGYEINNILSEEEFLAYYDRLKTQYPDKHPFIILDDPGQAEYTSVHSIMRHDLDELDLSELTQDEINQYDEEGRLAGEKGFQIRRNNIVNQIGETSFDDLGDLWIEDEDYERWKSYQSDFTKSFTRRNEAGKTWLFLTPTTYAPDAIAELPNGYFDGDLTPMENFVLSRELHEKYNYELFGIGASTIAFLHPDPATEETAKELVQTILPMYEIPDEINFAEEMVKTIVGKRHFTVWYNGG